jgi:hypothetical protein
MDVKYEHPRVARLPALDAWRRARQECEKIAPKKTTFLTAVVV